MSDDAASTPTSVLPEILTRLTTIEATAVNTSETLVANVRAVEALVQRYFELAGRIAAVERALTGREGTDV